MTLIFVVREFREKILDVYIRHGGNKAKSVGCHRTNSLKLARVERVTNKAANASFSFFSPKNNKNNALVSFTFFILFNS